MADAESGVGPTAATRRAVLKAAALTGLAAPVLASCGGSSNSAAGQPGGKSTTGGSTSGTSNGSTTPESSGAPDGFATTSEIPKGGGAIFSDVGVVVTQPTAGDFKGFTNICTHAGCPLASVFSTINCNCHGSKFSITDGSVVQGPATQPLPVKPIKVQGGSISLA